jgi:hypothetical protein
MAPTVLVKKMMALEDKHGEVEFIEAVLVTLSRNGKRVRLKITYPTPPRRRGQEFKSR